MPRGSPFPRGRPGSRRRDASFAAEPGQRGGRRWFSQGLATGARSGSAHVF